MSKRLSASFFAVMASCGLALAGNPQELLQRATTNPTTAPTTEPATQATSARVPDLTTLLSKPQSPMTAVQQRYDADRTVLNRFYVFAFSPTRYARMRMFNADWSAALLNLKTDGWTNEAKDQRAKLIETATTEIKRLDSEAAEQARLVLLLPFANAIVKLGEARLKLDKIDPQQSAATLASIKEQADAAKTLLTAKTQALANVDDAMCIKAADATGKLRENLRAWFGFYSDYDPMFTWWVTQSYKDADQALNEYATLLKRKPLKKPDAAADDTTPAPAPMALKLAGGEPDVPDLTELLAFPQSEMRGVISAYANRGGGGRGAGAAAAATFTRGTGGRNAQFYKDWLAALQKLDFDSLSRDAQIDYLLLRTRIQTDLRRIELRDTTQQLPIVKDESGISGRPIGTDALMIELQAENIPYTPQELINLAEKEYVWCEAEIKKASREMGFGDDWKKAIEHVKTMYVPPGQQPYAIRDLALEATDYVQNNNMVTVPEVARESWRSEMMSPQRQLVNPFFTGGETISISFPTSTMSYEAKMQSLRGNNIPFSHATVFHELIPGHELQGFMNGRYRSYRRTFNTPFWIEGWSLYWEFILYDRGFQATPENRVGALFWRMHRCARIVFSLGFHMGKMKPQECVDYLVAKVGHEPQNAAAEVRRSFGGGYTPLYQAGYMLGGLQIRSLRHELVDSGKMTERQFHDALLKENSIPIAMMRADLSGEELSREYAVDWKFYGPNP
jgi:hypothetical protein